MDQAGESRARRTFDSQSAFVLPTPGRPGDFIFIANRWSPNDANDGRYVWLPIQWEDGKPVLKCWIIGIFPFSAGN